jgi:hypothetical protein
MSDRDLPRLFQDNTRTGVKGPAPCHCKFTPDSQLVRQNNKLRSVPDNEKQHTLNIAAGLFVLVGAICFLHGIMCFRVVS